MDFRSSAQAHPTVTQLVADDEILANAVEFTTSDAEVVLQSPGGAVEPVGLFLAGPS